MRNRAFKPGVDAMWIRSCRSLSFPAAFIPFIALLVFLAGCSMPVMVLVHTARIDTTYTELGPIRIGEFEDKRPSGEMEGGKTATNSLSAQIWSGSTVPNMMVYFRNVLSEEASRTKLFTLSESAEFELSGEVISMKVDRKATIVRYLAVIPAVGGFLASEPEDRTLLWVGLAGSLAVSALEFPLLTATVRYRVVLTRNNTPVVRKEIFVTKKKRHWGYTEWGWKSVSEKAGALLDDAITQSVADLFHEIETELNRNMN